MLSCGAPSRVSSEVQLPSQMFFNGKSSWDGFIKPFISLSVSCGWSQEEKLFRLTNSLRDEASEYAFGYLPYEALQSFDVLVAPLEVQFGQESCDILSGSIRGKETSTMGKGVRVLG